MARDDTTLRTEIPVPAPDVFSSKCGLGLFHSQLETSLSQMIWSSPWSSLLFTFLLLDGTTALWPFPKKRFTANRFITAGPLGLQDAERVVAFGDFDGDQL